MSAGTPAAPAPHDRLPRHVAIVMDGNGRWAQQRSLPRTAGHREGAKTVRRIVQACSERGIAVLTLFAFSSENWHRPRPEVEVLMNLFLTTLRGEIRRLDNRLQAVLARYYPAALQVFHATASPVALRFLQAFPTPTAAADLSRPAFGQFARANRYRQSDTVLSAAYARLQAAYPVASPTIVAAYQAEAVWLAQQLLASLEHKQRAMVHLHTLFQQHPDREVFASLPGVGDFLAPALLAKFGDDRARFPDPQSVQCLAGTCPVTDQSGKRRRVYFRQACDHEFRQIAQQWARASLGSSSWAATYWHRVMAHSRSVSHAYRCLANRWLAIAWKCWQSHQPYDEAIHLQNRAWRVVARGFVSEWLHRKADDSASISRRWPTSDWPNTDRHD